MRAGIGFDVHTLVEGRPLVLGGVVIPFPKGLHGHSDADVLVHAIMDALLGAISAQDIGQHFPDADERYRGVSSIALLEEVGGMLRERGYRVRNVDAVVMAESPKIAPYREEMASNVAKAIGVGVGDVSIKATTTEKLGFVGRQEGIAAQAIAMVEEVGTGGD